MSDPTEETADLRTKMVLFAAAYWTCSDKENSMADLSLVDNVVSRWNSSSMTECQGLSYILFVLGHPQALLSCPPLLFIFIMLLLLRNLVWILLCIVIIQSPTSSAETFICLIHFLHKLAQHANFTFDSFMLKNTVSSARILSTGAVRENCVS